MRKSLFSWDSKPTEPAPFIDLLLYRSSIRSIYENKPDINQFLDQIPDISKTALQKYKTDSVLLTNHKFRFQRGSLLSIYNYTSSNTPNDATTCVILYHCLCLRFIQKEKQSDDFLLAFKSLNLTFKSNQTLSQIRDSVFLQLIQTIISESNRTKLNEEIYHHIFDHLNQNPSFDSSNFNLFVQLFKQVKSTNNHEIIEEMYKLIIHLFNTHASFFDFGNLSSFISILDLKDLNMNSIMILAQLTTKTSSLKDFGKISDSLLQYIKKLPTKEGLEYRPVESNLIPRIDSLPRKIYESVDHGFFNCFTNFPFELFDNCYSNLCEMIIDDIQKVLPDLGAPLKVASKQAQQNYITQSLDIIRKSSKLPQFYQIIASFFETFRKLIDKESLQSLIPFVASSDIFSQEYHVFDSLPKPINTLRNFLFSLIETIQPAQVTMLLMAVQDRTIILTECFMRILSNFDKYNPSLFTSKPMIEIIMTTGMKLQAMPPSLVAKPRNAFFLFLNELITSNPYDFLTSTKFCEDFLYFIYEPSLTSYILTTFKNSLQAVPNNSCLRHCSDCLHYIILNSTIEIIEKLSLNLIKALQNNVTIAFNFINLIFPLLDSVMKFNNHAILDYALSLLLLIELCSDFNIDVILYEKLSRCIHQIFGHSPSRRVEFQLFGILSKSLADTPTFYIRTPSVIPIILTSFSSSNRLEFILCKFMDLCQYSNSNMAAFDNGDLVLILSQLILSNHINYNHYEFDFLLSDNQKEELVYPLIKKIMLYQSNNSVISFYLDHLDNPKLSEFFLSCLHHCPYPAHPQFPIGRLPRQFTVKGLYGDDFKNGFSVHFTLNLDNLNQICNKPLDIFSITDANNALFSIYLQDNDIYTKYEANQQRTTVMLVRTPPVCQQTDFTFIYKFLDNKTKIQSFSNLQPLNDSDFIYFKFSNELILSFAGNDDSSRSIEHAAICSNFQIYSSPSLSTQDIIKRPYLLDDQVLFDSNCIKNPSKSYEFSIARIPNKNVKNCTNNLVISVYDSLESNQNLLTVFLRTNLANSIVDKFYLENVLALLKILFRYPSTFQKTFSSCQSIYFYLMKHHELIIKEYYFSFYDIFNEIKNENLKNEWFKFLIINIWLWHESKPEDFIEILSHWGKVVVYSNQEMFSKESYWHNLFLQFLLFFSDDDCIREFRIPQCNDSDTSRELFLNYVTKVASLPKPKNMVEDGIKTFFQHFMSTTTKPTLLSLFKIYEVFTNQTVDSTQYFPNLLALLCDDLDINEAVILAIHSMFKKSNNSYLSMITAYETLRTLGKNKSFSDSCELLLTSSDKLPLSAQSTSDSLNELNSVISQSFYDRLCLKFTSYPNLLPFLCLFSLEIGQENEFASLLNKQKETIAPVAVQNDFWFFLPIVLGFNCDEEHCCDLCNFLIYTATKSKDYNKQIPYIAVVISLLMFAIEETSFLKLFVNSIGLINPTDPKLIEMAVDTCFYITFFHFHGKSYHDFVIEELEQEGVKANIVELEEIKKNVVKKEHTSQINSVRSINDIRELIKLYTSINLQFELRIDQKHNWQDSHYASTAITLLMNYAYKNESICQIFQYFKDRNLIDSESNLRKLQFDLDKNIQSQFETYKNVVKSCLSSLIERYIKQNLLPSMKQNFEKVKNLLSKDKTKYQQVVLGMVEKEIQRSWELRENKKTPNSLEPDLTACLNYTPMKMKPPKSTQKVVSKSIRGDELLFEYPCKNLNLKCYRSFIQIGDRIFESNDLLLAVSRKKDNKESMIELFFQNGESFLLDLSPNDNSVLLKSLQKANYKHSIIQKGRSHSFFTSQFPYLQQWESGILSNYSFLCLLNVFGGISYHDQSISPKFPKIITDDNLKIKSNLMLPNSPTTDQFYYLMPKKLVEINSSINISENDSKSNELIYQLRKLLESSEVSNQLLAFIDNNFGYKIPSSSPALQLFKQKLKPKSIYKCPNKLTKPKIDRLKTTISHTNFMYSEQSNFYFMNILSNGHELKILKLTTVPQFKTEFISSQTVEADEKSTIYSGFQKNFIYFNRHFLQLNKFSNSTKGEINILPVDVKILECGLDNFLFTSGDYSVHLASIHCKNRPQIYLSKEKIIKMVSNPPFKVFSIATANQHVSIISLNTENLVNTVNVRAHIVNMIYTQQWSFLVVFTTESIVVLNVDGVVVKYVNGFNEFVGNCQTFSSLTGFDYVVYQNEKNDIILFEAFYPDKRRVLFTATSKMNAMVYDYTTSSLIFIFSNGKVQMQPISLD